MKPGGRPDILLVSDEDQDPDDHYREVRKFLSAPAEAHPSGFDPAELPHAQHLGPAVLGAHLRRHGFEAAVVDNVFRIPRSLELFRAALETGVPAVGISTGMLRPGSIRRILKEVRSRTPEARIILGGETAWRDPSVAALGDVTVIGYGERALPQVLQALRDKRGFEGIENLIIHRAGRLVRTQEDPGLWPEPPLPPAWDLLESRPSVCYPVEASRGCRHTCLFCTYPALGRRTPKDAEAVLADLAAGLDAGARLFRFMDSNFTSSPEETERLCARLARARLGARWCCYARPDDLAARPGLAEELARGGCEAVLMGVDSGDDGILRAMGKGYDSATALEGIRRAKAAGLVTLSNFIIGFPGETRESVDRTLEFVSGAGLDIVSFSGFSLRGASAAWKLRERLGLEGYGTSWRHGTMDSDESREHVRRAIEAVRSIPGASIGMLHLLVQLLAYGLEVQEVLVYLGAVKEWHAARGRPPADARRRLEEVWERLRSARRRWGAPAPFESSSPAPRASLGALGRLAGSLLRWKSGGA